MENDNIFIWSIQRWEKQKKKKIKKNQFSKNRFSSFGLTKKSTTADALNFHRMFAYIIIFYTSFDFGKQKVNIS